MPTRGNAPHALQQARASHLSELVQDICALFCTFCSDHNKISQLYSSVHAHHPVKAEAEYLTFALPSATFSPSPSPRHILSKIMLLSIRTAACSGALSRGALATSRSGGAILRGSFS